MLTWMYYVKPNTPRDDYVPQEHPEDIQFPGSEVSSDETVNSMKKSCDASPL